MSSSDARTTTATGGLLFAGTMLILTGIFQFFQGITAIAKDPVLLQTPNYVFKFNVTTWGWIHVVLGLGVVVVGYFVLARAPWARGVAIALTALQAFTSFWFLPYYPLWALVIVALDVFVIWALAVAPADQR